MKILGIDPSYTNTGLAVVENGILTDYKSIKSGGNCYTSLGSWNAECLNIVNQILEFVKQHNISEVIIEVPAPSSSGFYLMALHGWIVAKLSNNYKINFVSCKACDSFIGNKTHSKTFIVKYCKSVNWVPNKRIDNDICTAVVLAHILESYKDGKFKNTLTSFSS